MLLGLGFLNPLLLWALPLAAVPIIIHLLNRRRYDTVRWAAMEYLLRAMKRNRRRLRMEQWLILLLRTLAIILLVMLVSRPQLSNTTFATTRTHHVVCVDDSASMAQRGGASNAFGTAVDAVQSLAGRLANSRNGDLLTLLRSSRAGSPELSGVPISPGLPSRVREVVSGWQVGDSTIDLGTVLQEARARFEANDDAGSAEYYLVTDMRKHDWLTETGKPNAAASAWLLELDEESEHLTLITVGANDSENLAVSALRSENRTCTMGVPLGFAVDVTNRGLAGSAPTELTIEIDQRSRVIHPVPPLQPGETTTVQVTQTFHTSGYHAVSASLPADRYPTDDLRSLAIDERESSKVLVVDGDPGETTEESETFFLNVALNPGGDSITGIDVRTIAEHELATLPDEELADVDMIWLCNVSRFDDKSVGRLEELARRGGGIVFFLGNQVDLQHYNEVLWKGGQGVLPAPLVEVRGDMDNRQYIHVADRDHDLFAINTEDLEFFFSKVEVGRYIAFEDDPHGTAKTLLRLGDAEGDVLMLARPFEQGGTVSAIGMSADAYWTLWPISPSYLVVCQQLHKTTARPQDFSRNNLGPTEVFHLAVDPGVHRPDVAVSALRGDGDVHTFAAPSTTGEAVELGIPMAELRGYGVFAVELTSHGGGVDRVLLSRNALLEEGYLERLGTSGFFSVFPPEVATRVSITEGADAASAQELLGAGGLWRLLAFGMLIGMLLETVLAWRFGRR